MHALNRHFDKIYCINLDRRTDRWENCSSQFHELGIDVERYSAVDGKSLSLAEQVLGEALFPSNINACEAALAFTVRLILTDAKQNNYSNILILEDDVVFSENISNIGEYISAVPEDWALLYLSANHNLHVMGVHPPSAVNQKVWRLHSTYAAHAVGIKAFMFDRLIAEMVAPNAAVDVIYSIFQKQYPCYALNASPVMVRQREGFSDIQNSYVNYDWLIK